MIPQCDTPILRSSQNYFLSALLEVTLDSQELRKAGAVSGEKSRSVQPLYLPDSTLNPVRLACRAARKSGKNFPAASKFAGEL